jgi:uncharacterized phiE125 gp8 family phage protein
MKYVNDRVTQPLTEPVTLDEFKTHLRYDASITVEDDLLNGLLIAAREFAEDFTGLSIVDSTWRTVVREHAGGDLRLMRAPALEIISVYNVASDGSLAAVDPTTYGLRDADKFPRLTGLSAAAEIRVDFRAGFVDLVGSPTTGVIPKTVKTAILIYAEALYDRDATMMPILQRAAESLLRPMRINLQAV